MKAAMIVMLLLTASLVLSKREIRQSSVERQYPRITFEQMGNSYTIEQVRELCQQQAVASEYELCVSEVFSGTKKTQEMSAGDLVENVAQKYGISPRLLAAMITQESNWNYLAVSNKGARGLVQIMPETARIKCGITNADRLFIAAINLDCSARIMSQLLAMFGGNVALALAAYNAGENAVKRYGGIPPYAETQNYVKRILAYL